MKPEPGARGGENYAQFQLRLLARHRSFVTDWLATAADLIMLGGLGLGISGRRNTGAATLTGGFVLAAIAHLFQPGTLRDELAAIAKHPLWSVRAETHRVRNKVRAR
jgi:hypothetical protein